MRTWKSSLKRLPIVAISLAALLFLAVACGDDEFKDPSTLCDSDSSAEEKLLTATPEITREHIIEVREKYRDLIRRQPNYSTHGGPALLMDENGEYTQVKGIMVWVTKKVDQSAIPAEDRIPDCLEGVPVQIVEEETDNRLLGVSQ